MKDKDFFVSPCLGQVYYTSRHNGVPVSNIEGPFGFPLALCG